MYISYTDGRRDEVASEAEAREIIERQYPGAVYGEDWEMHDCDGGERLLVWPDEVTAGPLGLGDTGANAVAEIVRP